MSRVVSAFLLSIMIVSAYTYCIERHARDAISMSHSRRASHRVPLNAPTESTCENESACICKGVVLAVTVEVPDPSDAVDWLVADGSSLQPVEPADVDVDERLTVAPRPISPIGCGTGARILLQSLLI